MSGVKRYFCDMAGCIDTLPIEVIKDAEVVLASDYDTLRTANQRLEALSVENIMLDVVPGSDGAGVEIYAQSVADVENKLTAMDDSLEFLEGQGVQLTADIQRLEGEVARLKADADRYQWLRSEDANCVLDVFEWRNARHVLGEELDSAIDAALAGDGGDENGN